MKKMKDLTIGCWLSTGNLLTLETILQTEFYDWVAIDLEHSAFTEVDARNVFALCERFGVHAFARIHGHDALQGRKMLDLGATGLIVPNVNSAGELKSLIEHFYYAPKGKRGVCLSRINKFGKDFEKYFEEFCPIIIPQIESPQAVENIDSITSMSEVDGVFLGPYDLSATLGVPGKFDDPIFVECLNKVKEVTLQKKKLLGIHVVEPDIEKVKERITEGYNLIAYSTDMVLLRAALDFAKRELLDLR